MSYTVESKRMPFSYSVKERLLIKSFKTSDAMNKFLATEDNSLFWFESKRGLKAGTYAFAGGSWHNVKKLDASILAHI